jgi:hypothetical protein
MWITYEKAITAYYDCCVSDGNRTSFKRLYKFPLDELYCDINKWSDIKMGKTCKYLLKFDFKDLKSEHLSVSRDNKISELGID